MDIPRKCSQCGRKPNMRRWRAGLERWCYTPVGRGGRMVRMWWCPACAEKDL